jgi:hypothetical protein
LKTLDRIRERDGARIFKEAADHLLQRVIMSIESHAGPKGLRRAMDELEHEAESISGLSAYVRRMISTNPTSQKQQAGDGVSTR